VHAAFVSSLLARHAQRQRGRSLASGRQGVVKRGTLARQLRAGGVGADLRMSRRARETRFFGTASQRAPMISFSVWGWSQRRGQPLPAHHRRARLPPAPFARARARARTHTHTHTHTCPSDLGLAGCGCCSPASASCGARGKVSPPTTPRPAHAPRDAAARALASTRAGPHGLSAIAGPGARGGRIRLPTSRSKPPCGITDVRGRPPI